MTVIREVPAVVGPSHGAGPPPPLPTGPARRHRLLVRILVGLLVTGLLLTVAGIGVALMMQSRLSSQVNRIEGVFTGLADRPEKPASGSAARAVNILVMGTDRRSEDPTTGTGATADAWVPGAQRTDTIMILHVDGDRDGASLISIPRDAWVDVPGHGPNKVNAAFSLAGPSLAVQTVEDLTDLRIDHLAVIDWSGFENVIDTLGGVTITVPRTVEDPHNEVVWVKGRQTLIGSAALLYVRQRYGLPLGDLDRVRRQQAVIRGLLRGTLATLGSAHPLRIYDLLDTLTENVTVDQGWSFGDMRDLVLDLREVHLDEMNFLTVPVQGFGREGAQSVVYLDRAGNQALWADVRADRVDRWVADNPTSVVSGPVK